jgi:hypothetical protein
MTHTSSGNDTSDLGHARDAAHLEELVRDLEGRSGAYDLMREHLDTARMYLLGSMPREYSFNLKLARRLLPKIDDQCLRTRITDFLRSQKSSIPLPKQRFQ